MWYLIVSIQDLGFLPYFAFHTHVRHMKHWWAEWLSGRVFDSRPRGRGSKSHQRHCVVSLSKTHLSLLTSGSAQKDLSWHNWKSVDGDVKNQIKQTNMKRGSFAPSIEEQRNVILINYIFLKTCILLNIWKKQRLHVLCLLAHQDSTFGFHFIQCSSDDVKCQNTRCFC